MVCVKFVGSFCNESYEKSEKPHNHSTDDTEF